MSLNDINSHLSPLDLDELCDVIEVEQLKTHSMLVKPYSISEENTTNQQLQVNSTFKLRKKTKKPKVSKRKNNTNRIIGENINVITAFKDSVIQSFRSVKNEDDLLRVVRYLCEQLNFKIFDISYLDMNGNINILISTLPKSFIKNYYADDVHKSDLLKEYITQRSAFYFHDMHSDLSLSPFTSRLLKVSQSYLSLMRRHSIQDVYSMPLKLIGHRLKASFSMYSINHRRNEFKNKINELHSRLIVLANCISCCRPILQLSNNDKPKAAKKILTRREIEILEAMGRYSFNQKQLSQHFGISVRTVETHMENIKKSLNVTVSGAAVYKAIELGEINVVPQTLVS